MSEEVWDEIYRLKRTIADLRVAIRELSERLDAFSCTMSYLSDEQAQTTGHLLGEREEQP